MERIVFVDFYENGRISDPTIRIMGNHIKSKEINFENVSGFRIVTTNNDDLNVDKLITKMHFIENDEMVFDTYGCEQQIYIIAPKYRYSQLSRPEKICASKLNFDSPESHNYYVTRNEDGTFIDMVSSSYYILNVSSEEELKDIYNQKISEYLNYELKNKR